MATLQKACDKVVVNRSRPLWRPRSEDVTQLDAERPELLPPALADDERIAVHRRPPRFQRRLARPMVIETLAEMSDKAIGDLGKRLAAFALSLIEHPEARPGGRRRDGVGSLSPR